MSHLFKIWVKYTDSRANEASTYKRKQDSERREDKDGDAGQRDHKQAADVSEAGTRLHVYEVVTQAGVCSGRNRETKRRRRRENEVKNRGEREEDKRAANGGETSPPSLQILSGFIRRR